MLRVDDLSIRFGDVVAVDGASVELAAGEAQVNWTQLLVGAAVSAITAYLCIALFLKLLDRVGLMPFVYYRIALALVLYAIWLG